MAEKSVTVRVVPLSGSPTFPARSCTGCVPTE